MKSANIVLYAVREGTRAPLASVEPDDAAAAFILNAAASRAINQSHQSGGVLPVLKCVLEEREDMDGKQVSARFTELDAATLAKRGEARHDLETLFKVKGK